MFAQAAGLGVVIGLALGPSAAVEASCFSPAFAIMLVVVGGLVAAQSLGAF